MFLCVDLCRGTDLISGSSRPGVPYTWKTVYPEVPSDIVKSEEVVVYLKTGESDSTLSWIRLWRTEEGGKTQVLG